MSSILHHPVDTNVPIGCGGAAVIPGDVIVGDGEAVVVLPAAMAGEIAREALKRSSTKIGRSSVSSQGASILNVYPPSEETRATYEREMGISD